MRVYTKEYLAMMSTRQLVTIISHIEDRHHHNHESPDDVLDDLTLARKVYNERRDKQ